jgi:hypothetical protein
VSINPVAKDSSQFLLTRRFFLRFGASSKTTLVHFVAAAKNGSQSSLTRCFFLGLGASSKSMLVRFITARTLVVLCFVTGRTLVVLCLGSVLTHHLQKGSVQASSSDMMAVLESVLLTKNEMNRDEKQKRGCKRRKIHESARAMHD